MKETNPIEQRIEALADKWNDLKEQKDVRIVRMHAKEEEMQMIDAFVWYMLGLDSLIDDIAFILDPLFTDVETYSGRLLHSLASCIQEWNELPKEEGVEFVPVNWEPDMQLFDKKNASKLFVANFNNLAEALSLEDGLFTVAILTFPHVQKRDKEVCEWLENVIKTGISPSVRFLVIDTLEYPVFDKLAYNYPKQIYTLIPDLDMDNVMSQVAAMGDPADPSTPYRIAFVNMMNAMGKEEHGKARKEGETCIRIAKENESHDPHWGIQVVVVNLALANDRLKTKEYDKAVNYTNKAIEAADALLDKLDPAVANSVSGQAYMTKASVYCYPKEWKKAVPCYFAAAGRYEKANNKIMAIEAYRMAGFCSAKSWGDDATEYLVKGFRLGESVDTESLKASTYSVLIKQLLGKPYDEYISYEEIDRVASGIYGKDWEEVIHRMWKQAPDVETGYADAISVTDVPPVRANA